jgi:quercetin dioxygenase-like cupin family protein
MNVTRYDSARTYEPPGHLGVTALQLHGPGFDEAATAIAIGGFPPGATAEQSSSDLERLYVMLEGRLTISTDEQEVVLGRLDSCRIASGEGRRMRNDTDQNATVLVIAAAG